MEKGGTTYKATVSRKFCGSEGVLGDGQKKKESVGSKTKMEGGKTAGNFRSEEEYLDAGAKQGGVSPRTMKGENRFVLKRQGTAERDGNPAKFGQIMKGGMARTAGRHKKKMHGSTPHLLRVWGRKVAGEKSPGKKRSTATEKK